MLGTSKVGITFETHVSSICRTALADVGAASEEVVMGVAGIAAEDAVPVELVAMAGVALEADNVVITVVDGGADGIILFSNPIA
jgi:hypothetical protein